MNTGSLVPLPDGRLFVGKMNPCFTVLKPDGEILWTVDAPGGDFRNEGRALSVSSDGAVVDFGFEIFGKSPLRFDLRALKLSNHWPADNQTRPPKFDGLKIEDWFMSHHPKLDGKPITLNDDELSHSFAVQSDGRRFVLGGDWTLRAFDAEGKPLWQYNTTDAVWAENITADGRLVVAAYGDGTIRWHRMDDGRELLALQVLSDRTNWVAWTRRDFMTPRPVLSGCCAGLSIGGPTRPPTSYPFPRSPD